LKTKITFKQHIMLIMRGFKIVTTMKKSVLLLKTLLLVTKSAYPFINIYFCGQILNEFAEQRRVNILMSIVAITLGANLTVMLLSSVLQRYASYHETKVNPLLHKIFTDKLLEMDYMDIENPQIRQLYNEIQQHQRNMGMGLSKFMEAYEHIIVAIIQIIMSIAMTMSLFLFKVPETSQLQFLNMPYVFVILLLVLSCSIFLAPQLSLIGERIWINAAEENNKSNRIFNFYFYELMRGVIRAKDIRIYDQKEIISKGAEVTIWDSWQKYSKYEAKYEAFATVITYLVSMIIYLFIVVKAYEGAFGVGRITQYVGAISQLSVGLSSIHLTIGELINNNAFLRKEFEFLDIPNRKDEGILSISENKKYEIEFHNVSFKYPGNDVYALKNVSFKIAYGKRVAFVGMNGSGKTTIIKLLLRLYEPNEGIITLNGIDIKKYKYDEYIYNFSVVFQDYRLLPFTLGQNVATNILYDSNRVNELLLKVGLEIMFKNSETTLDTYLFKNFEENSIEISNGEAQKIALARALYKDSLFIILDEPTATLDPLAEAEIYSKFNEIVDNKTTLYISHRLSSCCFCDYIIVFHQGEIVQHGVHETLIMDSAGKYYELWNAQAQYYV